MSDEFYVGYLSKSPPGLAKHTRRMVGALAVAVMVMLALVAARQMPAEPGVFEFGTQRSFEVMEVTPSGSAARSSRRAPRG
jgi:hypothetical protein